MSCAEMAELIDLPFGLWTRVDRRKHEFSRIHQVAPMCPSPDEYDRSVHMHFDHLFPYLFTPLCFRLRIDLLCFQAICHKLLITGN